MARTTRPRSAGTTVIVGALLVSLVYPSGAPMSSVTYPQDIQLARAALAALPRKPAGVATGYHGTVHEPYTGKTITFLRGQRTSPAVQIDHVSLADAWRTGARQLDQNTRARLPGDLLELVAVDGPTNEAKEDRDVAGWLPPNRAYRCRYVASQIEIKQKYRLWVTPAERAAMAGVLATCPSQSLPADSDGGKS